MRGNAMGCIVTSISSTSTELGEHFIWLCLTSANLFLLLFIAPFGLYRTSFNPSQVTSRNSAQECLMSLLSQSSCVVCLLIVGRHAITHTKRLKRFISLVDRVRTSQMTYETKSINHFFSPIFRPLDSCLTNCGPFCWDANVCQSFAVVANRFE